ncbi:hypothetical protein H6G76_29140 [Nostoc sp. FACHB-152]|uniref:hypothetical protein n=1 Tax=unclassified Nostoc TaxID=2593658 RepID=UPI001684661D|nr:MULTISPECIES: hypothetical protein [unclassified Nostoc]MBD2451124.1 hypothetical protein [Nostoc sp. FACHB-152]MBD2473286.1 hypothetical protein [Nostoc sp. FACHB-145]
MFNNQDEAPEKVRIRNNYRERILAEAKELDKSYLETVHFIIDCYFAFKKGVLKVQQPMSYTSGFNGIDLNSGASQASVSRVSTYAEQEDSGDETFSLDFDL